MKTLFLQKRLLFPADCGGKVRTLSIVRYLARWSDVTYLCSRQEGDQQYMSAMQDLGLRLETVPWKETPRGSAAFYAELAANVFSRYPYNVAKDYDPRLRSRAEEFLTQEHFDLVICDFVQMARNAIGLPGSPKLLFTHNVEAEIFQRHATTGPGWFRRKYMATQWRKMRRFEAMAGRQFDTVVAVSERDKRIFEEEYGWHHVRTIDTAVNTEHYRPNGNGAVPGRIVFVGSMDWLPNPGGVKYFVHDVWPRVRAACPGASFHIVGRNPGVDIRRLSQLDGIEVFGNVPDVRPHIAQASVVVVPLLVGGGTRLKIFEAMAMGKAVVSTSLGAEGLKVVPGQHIELADCPETFAQKVVQLLDDRDHCGRMADAARAFVSENFSAEKVARQFEQICRDTVAMRHS